MNSNWKSEMLAMTVLYRMLECKDVLPLDLAATPYEFIDDVLEQLHHRDLIQPDTARACWQLTKKGEAQHRQAVIQLNELAQFEVFAHVNLGVEPSSDNGFDPRFMEPSNQDEAEDLGTEDLRLAMVDYLAHLGKSKMRPEQMVYMQMLADGRFDTENTWFDLKLGRPFDEIKELCDATISWKNLADATSEASEIMESIYQAGLIEQRKREGHFSE